MMYFDLSNSPTFVTLQMTNTWGSVCRISVRLEYCPGTILSKEILAEMKFVVAYEP